MDPAPLRLGFIGGHGHHYLQNLLEDDSVALEAIAFAGDGHDNQRARARADRLPGASWFDDPIEMLEAFRPHVVSVGAVYGHNGTWIAHALRHNAGVVSDKPIAATWEQLEKIQQLARETHQHVITEFPFRARPEYVAARDAVAAGRIGQVVLATAQKSYRFGTRPPWYANREDYGGTILWVASHGIDAIRFTTGQRFVRVSGRQGNVCQPDHGSMEDHAVCVFELGGGGTAMVHADYLRPAKADTHGDDRVRLAGSLGVLEVRGGRCGLVTNDQAETDITDEATPPPVHRQLLAAVRGQSQGRYSTAASLEMAAVLLCARDAADAQTVVQIPEFELCETRPETSRE